MGNILEKILAWGHLGFKISLSRSLFPDLSSQISLSGPPV